jgi:hypothetical protein
MVWKFILILHGQVIVAALLLVLALTRHNMKFDSHLKVEGEYTVDVYRRDGNLSYSLGPYKNFITSTGLSYPHNFAFADCFRFISFGSGTEVNTIKNSVNGGWGTIGLSQPLSKFSYIGGRGTQYDTSHATSQYSSASFKETTSGLSLSRGWRIPAGDSNYFEDDYTFKEVMLTPGRPYVTGLAYASEVTDYFTVVSPAILLNPTSITYEVSPAWTTNQWRGHKVLIYDLSLDIQERTITSNTADTINWSAALPVDTSLPNYYELHRVYQLCTCQDTETNIDGFTYNGADYAASAIFYSGENAVSTCNATGAFVRIVKDIPVDEGDFLIFNYTLYLDVETGRNDFAFNMQAGRNQRTVKTPNWYIHALSGCHNLVHHGLKVISPGNITTYVPWGGSITQDGSSFWNAEYDYGESCMSSWGAPLEPSARFDRLSAYLSSDNLQFFANAKDGGQSGIGIPGFSGQSGLMLWRRTPYNDVVTGGQFSPRLYNIRQANTDGGSRAWPIPTDYTTETTDPATDFEYTPQHLAATFQTAVDHWTNTTNTPSTRTREVIRNFQFAGPGQTFAAPATPVRSIVLSYLDPNGTSYHLPYFDCLFTDAGTGQDKPSPLQYTTGTLGGGGAPNGSQSSWYYLEEDAKLTFSFKETWSSPCSPEVDGC